MYYQKRCIVLQRSIPYDYGLYFDVILTGWGIYTAFIFDFKIRLLLRQRIEKANNRKTYPPPPIRTYPAKSTFSKFFFIFFLTSFSFYFLFFLFLRKSTCFFALNLKVV